MLGLQTSLRAMGNEVSAAREEVFAAKAESEAAVEAERALRADAERKRDRARARGRMLKAREMSIRQQRWVRLGEALRLVRPR